MDSYMENETHLKIEFHDIYVGFITKKKTYNSSCMKNDDIKILIKVTLLTK